MERYSTHVVREQYILKGYDLCCVRLWSFLTLIIIIICVLSRATLQEQRL